MSKAKGPAPGKSNHPEERLPPANTIEQKYLEVLEETLTPPEVRKRLVESQSLEQKWRFIQIHKPLSEEKLSTWGDKETTILNTINNSRNPDIMSVLNLKVLLSSANKELMASFLEANGVAVLLKVILQKVNKKPITTIDVALLYEILLCCKLVMNNAIGMKGFLDVSGAIDTIALCLLFEYKPLALLVLEILSAVCYSEESTALVVHGVRLLSRTLHEAPFSSLNNAILTQDIELKLAVLQFIVSIILGANVDTHNILRKDLGNVFFDMSLEKAVQQINLEIESVEEIHTISAPLLNYQRAVSKNKNYSPKKVVNLDKLGGAGAAGGVGGGAASNLVALKGLRNSSMRGQFARQSTHNDGDLKARLKENLSSEASKAGKMSIPHTTASCMGSSSKWEERWCTVDGEYFRIYRSAEEGGGLVDKVIYIQDIRDIRKNTSDRLLYKLAEKTRLSIIEIITSSDIITLACPAHDHNNWLTSFQAARDQQVVSKSSYYMIKTYLELKDALKMSDRFRNLYEQYMKLSLEEKRYEVETFGFDVNDIDAVFQFLCSTTLASGHNPRFLGVLQELLLIPPQGAGMWEAVREGIKNLRRINSRGGVGAGGKSALGGVGGSMANVLGPGGAGGLDAAFTDMSITDLLAKKAEEEGDIYKDVSKLALSCMTLSQENGGLKNRICELENSISNLNRLLGEGESEEKKLLLEREEEVTRLTMLLKGGEEIKRGDDEQIVYLSQKIKELQSEIERYVEDNGKLNRLLEDAERKVKKLSEGGGVGMGSFGGSAWAGGGGSAGGGGGGGLDGSVFEKYEKMRKMLPEGAVRQKMKLDNISDEDVDRFFRGEISSAAASNSAGASVSSAIDDARYEKYEKMKKMLPEGAVKQKMLLDNFTNEEIDAFMAGKKLAPASSASPAPAAAADPRYEKYDKMRKMLPEGAVRQKMLLDNFTDQEIDAFFKGGAPAAATAASGANGAAAPAAGGVSAGGDNKFEKYEKMKKMLPEGAVRNKMKMDNISEDEIDRFFGGAGVSGGAGSSAAVSAKLPTLSPAQAIKYNKYEKLISKMTPEEIEKQMVADDVGSDEIATFMALIQHKIKNPAKPKAAGAGAAGGAKGAGDANSLKVKLKNIFWNKLPPQDLPSTLWSSLPPLTLPASHQALLEALFISSTPGPAGRRASAPGMIGGVGGQGGAAGGPGGSEKGGAAAKKALSVLDGKRTQNVSIVMGKLRLPPEGVVDLIWGVDPLALTADTTSMLLGIIPSPEEEKALKDAIGTEGEGAGVKLDPPSRLLSLLLRVPRLSQRLTCHEQIFGFSVSLGEIESQMGIYMQAIGEVKTAAGGAAAHPSGTSGGGILGGMVGLISGASPNKSPSIGGAGVGGLHFLLSLILGVGNFLNRGTKFGDAGGVRIDTLGKLGTLKFTEGVLGGVLESMMHGGGALGKGVGESKRGELVGAGASKGALGGNTALHLLAYLSNELDKSGAWLKFSEGWIGVWGAADLSFSQLQGQTQQLEANFSMLEKEYLVLKENKTPLGLGHVPLKDPHANPLFKRLGVFLEEGKIKMTKLKTKTQAVNRELETLLKSYGESIAAGGGGGGGEGEAAEDTVKRFFSLLGGFVRSLRKAHEENEKKRQAMERAAKAASTPSASSTPTTSPTLKPRNASIAGIALPKVNKEGGGSYMENIFGRFHSLQEQDSDDILAKYKMKLSVRVGASDAIAMLEGEGEVKSQG